MSRFWEISYPGLTEADTTHLDWDKTLYFPASQMRKWVYKDGMRTSDGLSITSEDGVWIGSIADLGDPEFGENWITVDLM